MAKVEILGNELVLREDISNGDQSASITAPSSLSSSVRFTLPTTSGVIATQEYVDLNAVGGATAVIGSTLGGAAVNVVSNTTVADVTGADIDITAGTWLVEVYGELDNSSGTQNAKVLIYPSAAVSNYPTPGIWTVADTSVSGSEAWGTWVNRVSTTGGATNAVVQATIRYNLPSFVVATENTNLKVQVAQASSSATTQTFSNTTIRAIKLA